MAKVEIQQKNICAQTEFPYTALQILLTCIPECGPLPFKAAAVSAGGNGVSEGSNRNCCMSADGRVIGSSIRIGRMNLIATWGGIAGPGPKIPG